jgi:cobyrinic acid a,c-diamide synthase
MRGVIVAGTHSGCGKTTVTLGIMAALRKRGLTVQPFKAGPDFIDAGLHRVAAGRPSRNLDQWMCGRDYVADCFRKHAATADISVIEGVMGMYDGDFNTAALAGLLQCPVLLVIDAYGMAESAGAMAYGFAEFGVRSAECGVNGGKPNLAGVIFNRVASENHYTRVKNSVRDVPVLGYLPRELNFEIPHRHLGLSTAEENPITRENLERLAETVLKYVDIENLLLIESKFPPFQGEGQGGDGASRRADDSLTHPHPSPLPEGEGERKSRIAIAYDKAFSFYYEDNLDMLRDAGAGIVRFSPLTDRALPDGVDAVYLGGGYPELHAEALAGNTSMLASIKAWSEAGKPLYAECGGLMYLSRGIRDFDGRSHTMAGVFPFETRMLKKPKLAYREIVLNEDCVLGTSGEHIRGHEFHYSEIVQETPRDEGCKTIYAVKDKNGKAVHGEGFRIRNTLASYIHVHFGSNPSIAECFVRKNVR